MYYWCEDFAGRLFHCVLLLALESRTFTYLFSLVRLNPSDSIVILGVIITGSENEFAHQNQAK